MLMPINLGHEDKGILDFWLDNYSNYYCIIRKNAYAPFLMGYVIIGQSNKFYGLEYDTIYNYGIEANFSSAVLPGFESRQKMWIFGFDHMSEFKIMPQKARRDCEDLAKLLFNYGDIDGSYHLEEFRALPNGE